MKLDDVLSAAKDSASVRRVFAEPVERDGVTVIAAATVSGGAGGGSGTDNEGQEGSGAGFGVGARPMGAYVLEGGRVRWQPALDVNRLITMVGIVTAAAILAGARIVKPRECSCTK